MRILPPAAAISASLVVMALLNVGPGGFTPKQEQTGRPLSYSEKTLVCTRALTPPRVTELSILPSILIGRPSRVLTKDAAVVIAVEIGRGVPVRDTGVIWPGRIRYGIVFCTGVSQAASEARDTEAPEL